jgi:hypothetical protein
MPKNSDGTFTLCSECQTRTKCAGRNSCHVVFALEHPEPLVVASVIPSLYAVDVSFTNGTHWEIKAGGFDGELTLDVTEPRE